jgi:hypothetical protein
VSEAPEGSPPPPPSPPATRRDGGAAPRRRLDTDRIVSLTAMLVGLGSLFVILYQTALTRQAQQASVLPYLMFALNANERGVYITVSNNGVGPARIEDVRVQYKGRDIVGDPYEFYTTLHPDSGFFDVNKLAPGRMLPASTSIELVGMAGQGPRTQALLVDFLRLFEIAEVPTRWYAGVARSPDRAVIVIIYSTVYGDRWRLRSDRLAPEPL